MSNETTQSGQKGGWQKLIKPLVGNAGAQRKTLSGGASRPLENLGWPLNQCGGALAPS